MPTTRLSSVVSVCHPLAPIWLRLLLDMLIDAHAHLDRYGAELEAALAEIRREGILTLSNSMDIASYERNVAIAKSCDLVVPTFGVHPWNAPEYAKDLEKLEPLIEESPMIGEVGLDHFFIKEQLRYRDQRKVFEFFLAAARCSRTSSA